MLCMGFLYVDYKSEIEKLLYCEEDIQISNGNSISELINCLKE